MFSDERLEPSRHDSFSRSSCISRVFFSRNSIGVISQPFGKSSIGCKLTPRTAQLLGIQLFLDRRRVTFPRIGPLVEIRGWDKAGGLKIVHSTRVIGSGRCAAGRRPFRCSHATKHRGARGVGRTNAWPSRRQMRNCCVLSLNLSVGTASSASFN